MAEEKKKKIIWVEDDQLLGSLLAQKLTHAGLDIMRATRGKEAMEIFDKIGDTVPDAIMVDLLLPDMDGFEILTAANRNPKLKDVPRIVLSNLDGQADRERATQLGAKRFMVKALTSLDRIVEEVKTLAN